MVKMLKKPGMSTHSIESFNETDAVFFLSSVLESKHTIKTFFGVNDKTPNHDGCFELIGEDSCPKKQFIVQIKKVENLTQNIKGANKGKYVYELKTNFLYYVKAKVTENPAIYFVVDISMRRIFWLYLSDEVLMQLNFEGHEKVSYAFTDANILIDINQFTQQLDRIASRRNMLLVNKPPEAIAKMQDAADYINQLLDHDLRVIKETMFPKLWRFGIKFSNTSDLAIGVNGELFTPPVSSLMALYPQMKGIPDTGIREYDHEETDLFNHYVLGGEGDPIEYSKHTLHQIIKNFFENGIPMKYLPDIVLKELISVFISESNPLFEDAPYSECLSVDEIERRFVLLARYTQYLILNPVQDQAECQIKDMIVRRYCDGERNFCNMAGYCLSSGGKSSFRAFCQRNRMADNTFSQKLFEIIQREYIQYFCMIDELRKRSILEVAPVWNYNWIELRQMQKDDFEKEVNIIIDRWFSTLPLLYEETYRNMFDNTKFHVTGRYIYKNGYSRYGQALANISSVLYHFPSSAFEIISENSIDVTLSPEGMPPDPHTTCRGRLFDDFIDRKTLFFDGISCLLYQGICEKLEFELDQLHIGSNHFNPGLMLLR